MNELEVNRVSAFMRAIPEEPARIAQEVWAMSGVISVGWTATYGYVEVAKRFRTALPEGVPYKLFFTTDWALRIVEELSHIEMGERE